MADPSDEIDSGQARSVPLPSGEDLTSVTSHSSNVGQTRDKQFRVNGLGTPKRVLARPFALAFEEPKDLYG